MSQEEIFFKAIDIALKAHAGQKDKSGSDYFLHPNRIASRLLEKEGYLHAAVGVLHDVIEDSHYTIEDLDFLLPEQCEALLCLTRKKEQSYSDYILVIKLNPIARLVKIQDLIDNMNLDRLPALNLKDTERQIKYAKALQTLIK